jgi:hypothetical protein
MSYLANGRLRGRPIEENNNTTTVCLSTKEASVRHSIYDSAGFAYRPVVPRRRDHSQPANSEQNVQVCPKGAPSERRN